MTVGILGAGQLGRMLALAGYPLGLDFLFLDPAADAPLVQSVAWAAAGLNPTRDKLPRPEASRQVRSFCERALGVTSPATRGG